MVTVWATCFYIKTPTLCGINALCMSLFTASQLIGLSNIDGDFCEVGSEFQAGGHKVDP